MTPLSYSEHLYQQLTPEKFAAWLHRHDPNIAVGLNGDGYRDPLALYLNNRLTGADLARLHPNLGSVHLGVYELLLPQWAVHYLEEMARTCQPVWVRPGACLEVLGFIEPGIRWQSEARSVEEQVLRIADQGYQDAAQDGGALHLIDPVTGRPDTDGDSLAHAIVTELTEGVEYDQNLAPACLAAYHAITRQVELLTGVAEALEEVWKRETQGVDSPPIPDYHKSG